MLKLNGMFLKNLESLLSKSLPYKRVSSLFCLMNMYEHNLIFLKYP